MEPLSETENLLLNLATSQLLNVCFSRLSPVTVWPLTGNRTLLTELPTRLQQNRRAIA